MYRFTLCYKCFRKEIKCWNLHESNTFLRCQIDTFHNAFYFFPLGNWCYWKMCTSSRFLLLVGQNIVSSSLEHWYPRFIGYHSYQIYTFSIPTRYIFPRHLQVGGGGRAEISFRSENSISYLFYTLGSIKWHQYTL